MPRQAIEDHKRISIRIHSADKATLLRAAALSHTDLTEFVIQHALAAARQVIDYAEHVELSERDSLLVLELIENPPEPNARLKSAASDASEE